VHFAEKSLTLPKLALSALVSLNKAIGSKLFFFAKSSIFFINSSPFSTNFLASSSKVFSFSGASPNESKNFWQCSRNWWAYVGTASLLILKCGASFEIVGAAAVNFPWLCADTAIKKHLTASLKLPHGIRPSTSASWTILRSASEIPDLTTSAAAIVFEASSKKSFNS